MVKIGQVYMNNEYCEEIYEVLDIDDYGKCTVLILSGERKDHEYYNTDWDAEVMSEEDTWLPHYKLPLYQTLLGVINA